MIEYDSVPELYFALSYKDSLEVIKIFFNIMIVFVVWFSILILIYYLTLYHFSLIA